MEKTFWTFFGVFSEIYADEDLPLERYSSLSSIGPNKIDYRLSWQLRTILAAAELGTSPYQGEQTHH